MVAHFNGAKVALFIGDRLLITLRDDRLDIPFPNMWDFPGGGREGGETPFETMARETFEEVASGGAARRGDLGKAILLDVDGRRAQLVFCRAIACGGGKRHYLGG